MALAANGDRDADEAIRSALIDAAVRLVARLVSRLACSSSQSYSGIPRFRALIVRAGATGNVTRTPAKAANLSRNFEKPRRTVWETSTESNWW